MKPSTCFPGKKVKYVGHTGGITLVHKICDRNAYEKFKKLQALGIGPMIKGYSDGAVVMEEVIPLHKCNKGDLPDNFAK